LPVTFENLVTQDSIALDVPGQLNRIYCQKPFNATLRCNLTKDGVAERFVFFDAFARRQLMDDTISWLSSQGLFETRLLRLSRNLGRRVQIILTCDSNKRKECISP
jgi:hypothetical protein